MNVFVSRPTVVGADYERAYEGFHAQLVSDGYTLRRLGGGDHSKKAPLRAVIDLINECCGAIILGYPQLEFQHHALRSAEYQNNFRCIYPTPWNQIEGALAYACRCPVLVVAHPGISGGVFDHGITGEAVLHIDLAEADWYQKAKFSQPFKEWSDEVRACAARR